MKTLSLRWRIAIWSALVSALSLLTFTVIIAFNLYHEQIEMIDAQLAAHAAQVATPDDHMLDTLAKIAASPRKPGAEATLHGFALLRTTNATLIRAQPAALAQAFAEWPLDRWPPRKTFLNTRIDGIRLRVGAFARGEMTLLLAASVEPAEEIVRDLLAAAAIALPLVLLVVAGGSAWIARRALQPIADITRAAASITADRLGERLPAPQTADEIGRHTDVLNGMFDRLQRSFEQATRFTADAAHELRTPLTIMRGQVEDALRNATPEQERPFDRLKTPGEVEGLLIGLLEEITGLQKISDNLLLLARFDAGKNPLQRAPLDFSILLAEAHEDAELLATPKNLKVSAEIAPAVRVEGDAVMLRRLTLNLIDNAVKFNRTEGEVKLTLRIEGSDVVLTVGNTGTGIPPERRPALFERFYRSDTDHNRASGGSGLGLSLCREIATAHGGRIELNRAETDWTEFTVRLPLLPTSQF